MNPHFSIVPQGPARRWDRICRLVAETSKARRNRYGAQTDAGQRDADKAELDAMAELCSELRHLAEQGVLDEIGNCLALIYGRAEDY